MAFTSSSMVSGGRAGSTPTGTPNPTYTTGAPPTLGTANLLGGRSQAPVTGQTYNPLAISGGRAAGTQPTSFTQYAPPKTNGVNPLLTSNAPSWSTPATTPSTSNPSPSGTTSTPGGTTSTPSTPAPSSGQYNPLTFKPLDVPNDSQALNSTMLNDPGTFYGDFQNVLNHAVVQQGNRAAQAAVDKYNGEMKTYLLNGGANNTYGYQAPVKPDLTQFYKPAMAADSQYVPPTGDSTTGGTWRPGGVGSVPQGVNGTSNVAPWTPPSTWTPNAQNTNYNPLNPNQGNTSATTSTTGSQGGLNSFNNPGNQQQQSNNQSAFTQYINNVLGGNNSNNNSQPNLGPVLQQLAQFLNGGGYGNIFSQQPTTSIFGQYNPFGQFGGGLGNMGQSQLSNYGLSGLNNNSFYFPQFM